MENASDSALDIGKLNAEVQGLKAEYMEALDTLWMLLAASLVFFMHSGFSFLEAGSVRVRNAQSILTKNLLAVTVGFLGWWAFGWGFAYGVAEKDVNEFIGHTDYFAGNFFKDKTKFRQWFFQGAFCATACTIVSGAVAERIQLRGFGIIVVILTTLVYPIVIYWGWSGEGFLNHPKPNDSDESESLLGPVYLDFAGSGLVHMVGGVAALVTAFILGPRAGRFERGREYEFDPHNVPFIVLGTFLLWFGWYGFNPGSTLSMSSESDAFTAGIVAMNTTLAPCSGGLLVLLLRSFFMPPNKIDVVGMCNGILAGLVSITAGCAFVEPWEAVIIGFIGGLVYVGSSFLLKVLKIDDVVDAIPVHGACGFWGILALGFFGDESLGLGGNGVFYGGSGQLFVQLVAGIFIALFVGATMGSVACILQVARWLRVSEDYERAGADVSKHSPARAYVMPPGVAAAAAGPSASGAGGEVCIDFNGVSPGGDGNGDGRRLPHAKIPVVPPARPSARSAQPAAAAAACPRFFRWTPC